MGTGIPCVEDKLELISANGVYPLFDLTTSCELIVRSAADVMGFNGKVELAADKGNTLTETMETSVNGESSRAEPLLGWQSKR